MNSIERDPKKRRVKPIESQASLLDFDLGESSDDSDFRIEDHAEESDDDSIDSNGEGGKNESGESESESDSGEEVERKERKEETSVADVIFSAKQRQADNSAGEGNKIMICCGCLGDRSDDVNEIIECDGCGVTVHEACYGVSDTASVNSAESDCPTEPWFCEACRAGVTAPACELCPNSGGIFKETDVGKWVHLVCALYVPGVAFGEVDQLSSVTLFEMAYNKWGAKTCSLCEDDRLARTGVCIGCDAGMCRTYFHVTCAQREGFLSEAHSEEVDQADPFYAHCRLHSDKALVKRRRRNWLAWQARSSLELIKRPDDARIQRKLERHRVKFLNNKRNKSAPWVPTQKMPRPLTTSASACRRLLKKAELMGVDASCVQLQEAQAAAVADARRKWHVPPAFSVEFVSYYLDRNDRLKIMKAGLERLLEANTRLLDEQRALRARYDRAVKDSADQSRVSLGLKQQVHGYHSTILSACPTARGLPAELDDLHQRQPPMTVPTAAALKMGVGFPLSALLQLNECGTCGQRRDQHLLAKCDTCHLYYHLDCLNPPLTRLPKKSKLYGWQCSECDRSDDDAGDARARPRAGRSSQPTTPRLIIRPPQPPETELLQPTSKSPKKRRRDRDKHRHSSGEVPRERKRKRKKKSLDLDDVPHPRITIKIKPIPLPAGEVATTENPQCFYVPSADETSAPVIVPPPISAPVITTVASDNCDVCRMPGTPQNTVNCDECHKYYHFTCLDPPVKKTPKRRGYSWHCADCDPTETESN